MSRIFRPGVTNGRSEGCVLISVVRPIVWCEVLDPFFDTDGALPGGQRHRTLDPVLRFRKLSAVIERNGVRIDLRGPRLLPLDGARFAVTAQSLSALLGRRRAVIRKADEVAHVTPWSVRNEHRVDRKPRVRRHKTDFGDVSAAAQQSDANRPILEYPARPAVDVGSDGHLCGLRARGSDGTGEHQRDRCPPHLGSLNMRGRTTGMTIAPNASRKAIPYAVNTNAMRANAKRTCPYTRRIASTT